MKNKQQRQANQASVLQARPSAKGKAISGPWGSKSRSPLPQRARKLGSYLDVPQGHRKEAGTRLLKSQASALQVRQEPRPVQRQLGRKDGQRSSLGRSRSQLSANATSGTRAGRKKSFSRLEAAGPTASALRKALLGSNRHNSDKVSFGRSPAPGSHTPVPSAARATQQTSNVAKPWSRPKLESNLNKKRQQQQLKDLGIGLQIGARKKQRNPDLARLGEPFERSMMTSTKETGQPRKHRNLREGSKRKNQPQMHEGGQALQRGPSSRSRSIPKRSRSPAPIDSSSKCLSINISQADGLGQRDALRALPDQSSYSVVDQSFQSGHQGAAAANTFFKERTNLVWSENNEANRVHQNPKGQWKESLKLKKAGTVEQAARKSQALVKQIPSAAHQKMRKAGGRSKSSARGTSKAGRVRRSASGRSKRSRSRASKQRSRPGNQASWYGPPTGVHASTCLQTQAKHQNLAGEPESYGKLIPLSGEPGPSPYCSYSHSIYPDSAIKNYRACGPLYEDCRTVSSRDRDSHRKGAGNRGLIPECEQSGPRQGKLGRVAHFCHGSSQSLSIDNYQLSEERRRSHQARNAFYLAQPDQFISPYCAARQSAGASSFQDSENSDIDFYPHYPPQHPSQPLLAQELRNPPLYQRRASAHEAELNARTPRVRRTVVIQPSFGKHVQTMSPMNIQANQSIGSAGSASYQYSQAKLRSPRSCSARRLGSPQGSINCTSKKRKMSLPKSGRSKKSKRRPASSKRSKSGLYLKAQHGATLCSPLRSQDENSLLYRPQTMETCRRRQSHCQCLHLGDLQDARPGSCSGPRQYDHSEPRRHLRGLIGKCRETMREIALDERVNRISPSRCKDEVRQMRARQEDRLGQLKDEMRQSLIGIKETKQRLQPDKENGGHPDFKEQVRTFSRRIDQLIERKHEKDIDRAKDKQLKMELQKMKAMRIVKEQFTKEKVDDERFKEQLLLTLAEQIDREMKSSVRWRSPRDETNGPRSESKLNQSERTPSACSFKSNKASFRKLPSGSFAAHAQASEKQSRLKSARRRSSKRSCEKTIREFNLCKTHEKENLDRPRSKSRSRYCSLKSIESRKSARSTKSTKRRNIRSSASKQASNRKQKSARKGQRQQAHQTECRNSKNSTIVHQCKASASSARRVAADPSAPTLSSRMGAKAHQLNEMLMNQVRYDKMASTQPRRKHLQQPSGKKLRFHMDHLQESAAHDGGIENARGASGRSGGRKMRAGAATYDLCCDLHACDCCPKASPYLNKVDEASNWKMGASRKSILKNSSAKKSFAATPASNGFQSRSSSGSGSESQQGALSPTWRRARQLITQKTTGHRLASSSSESDDSDSDEGFQYRSHAALTYRAGQTLGRSSTRDEAHLPMWQRLAINQIRI